ncbi:Uracil DNA glycosylase superfamily protein [Rhodoblastus acidophilus]|uniref:Uracil DNA glycosylase superfamily protein n=1 Tax=Rhodoblastus acidophilus TaxID=1074 RepID=A0A212RP17_RHOAC|nr:hypothetical protein [Rhodoblastus acidophilus]PPQ36679.1 hypothetical protein CKO16_16740 [Rhodoblastus acidophilus]RAI21524.1 hypothetical protein CH337_07565 [Rhodoblastus acidophilus]SNB74176.1 Uracil DNA glycosylase superfamily protein [Rhodoblastus acidophilus]
MSNELFSEFKNAVSELAEAELLAEVARPQRLLIASDHVGARTLDVAYAPFDHVNLGADIVIVGITPGRHQMQNALLEARRCLKAGLSDEAAKSAAKVFASFSGPMRTNLVSMLDSVGVNQALGLSSTATLWGADAARVHFTSALRYPVFIDNENYSGAPSMLATPLLKKQLMQWFATEMEALPNAVFVPLGPKVTEAVEVVASKLGIGSARILSGLPHPSGANAERIAFFLGRKKRADVSAKVDADRLLACRAELETKIGSWR